MTQDKSQVGIRKLIESRQWPDLRDSLSSRPAPELAEMLPTLEKPERVLVFRLLPRALGTEVFSYLGADDQDALLRDLTDEETRSLLAGLTPDDRTHLLAELPARITRRLVNLLSPADLREARSLLGYPEESTGRLMTPDYVAVRPHWSIRRALDHVRVFGKDSETINRIYVTDDAGRLLDDIELRRVILADPDAITETLMNRNFVSVSAFADREEAVKLIRKYDLVALPVVDSAGVLLGIVTVDDILDVEQAEVTEDFHKVGSVEPIRTSLRETGLRVLYRSRIAWLLVLVLVNVFSGASIAFYQETISETVALVFFLPLLIASSGNAGAQSATLMVRAMATGDARIEDWLKLLVKELAVASAMGVTMAMAVSLLGFWRAGPEVAAVVALTMILVVIVGSLVGMSLPFLLSRFGFDPATASAPLVTSIADISGVLIYLSIATWYLHR
ncbi:MAG TPA: magnesium transporter [Bryobacteraceae bacterium]|nr:magnesium transporter [Bryobacteraceae bacterium]